MSQSEGEHALFERFQDRVARPLLAVTWHPQIDTFAPEVSYADVDSGMRLDLSSLVQFDLTGTRIGR